MVQRINYHVICLCLETLFCLFRVSFCIFFNLLIYLAVSGLSCITKGLLCGGRTSSCCVLVRLWLVGPVVPWQEGSSFPDQGLNPGPLLCKVASLFFSFLIEG